MAGGDLHVVKSWIVPKKDARFDPEQGRKAFKWSNRERTPTDANEGQEIDKVVEV